MTKRILSGMQPTGVGLHIGNYIGALQRWVATQNESERNFYMIADLHAITLPQQPKDLREATWELAAAYIAAGIDHKKNPIFIQSSVPAHAEMAWILTCLTPMGWLNRMTQFKDKAGKNKDSIGTGLFAYPPLMAADILLYHTTHVPVGEDQKQHVELTRDVAMAFNREYGEILTVPEPLIATDGARIKSLRDGTKKMSKSDPSEMSRINLSDPADVIADKIKRAKTDTGVMPEMVDDFADRPEVENLVAIYAALGNQSTQHVVDQFAGQQFAPFKQALADLLVEKITPIGTELRRLLDDKHYLQGVLTDGRNRAATIADMTLRQVKDAMGFVALD